MGEPGRRAFVCGHPVAHSRSPLIHRHWLAMLGIAGSYERVDVAPEDFAGFIGSLAERGYAGGNVTIPHKEAAHALVPDSDEASSLIGAVNTIWLEDGALKATNTDWWGFSADLDSRAPRWRNGETAVVLGAGGAARAIVFALAEAGYREILVVNRTLPRARELADRFGPRVSAHPWEAIEGLVAGAALIVNTTSLGMEGKGEEAIGLGRARAGAIAVDIVYVPLETTFLRAASEQGLETVDGLGMLLHQAVPGFERWFGRRPNVTPELRALVVADLEAAR